MFLGKRERQSAGTEGAERRPRSGGRGIGRLNRDRRPDIAVANYSDDDVSVFIQRRNGKFRRAPDLAGGPGNWQLEIADLNRDGRDDIVTSNYDNVAPDDAISVHLGKAKGFRPVDNYPGGQSGFGLEIGKLNGDRRPDVVGSTYQGPEGTVDTYVTRENGTLREGDSVTLDSLSYSPLALGDFAGGRALDAVVADNDSDSLTILTGDGTGGLAASLVPTPPVEGVWGIASGNLNGKGRADLAVNRYDDEEVQVLYGRDAGGFNAGPTYPLSHIRRRRLRSAGWGRTRAPTSSSAQAWKARRRGWQSRHVPEQAKPLIAAFAAFAARGRHRLPPEGSTTPGSPPPSPGRSRSAVVSSPATARPSATGSAHSTSSLSTVSWPGPVKSRSSTSEAPRCSPTSAWARSRSGVAGSTA